MASKTQDQLLKTFREIAGERAGTDSAGFSIDAVDQSAEVMRGGAPGGARRSMGADQAARRDVAATRAAAATPGREDAAAAEQVPATIDVTSPVFRGANELKTEAAEAAAEGIGSLEGGPFAMTVPAGGVADMLSLAPVFAGPEQSSAAPSATELLNDGPRAAMEGAIATALGNVAMTTAGSSTRAASQSSSGSSGGGGGVADAFEHIASTVFQNALGMAPLVKGLLGLFSGGTDSTPPPLEKYAMPEAIHFEAAETGTGLMGLDYDQMGMPRVYSPAATTGGAGRANGGTLSGGAAGVSGGSAAPQITVNVQAMDAQSFLDHSSQIAQAVRGAMLNLSSINDVVNEL